MGISENHAAKVGNCWNGSIRKNLGRIIDIHSKIVAVIRLLSFKKIPIFAHQEYFILKKFLFIRFSSIGDIVLTTPLLRCLKNQVQDAEVHYLTKKQYVPILEANSYVERIFSIQHQIGEVVDELKRENYDHIIDLHKNFRSKGVTLLLRKPSSSFDKINFEKWLSVNLKINRLPRVHIVDRYFGALAKFGVKNDSQGLDYFIPGKDEVDLNSLPGTHQNGYIGWVIGARHNTKIFPVEQIIDICLKTDKTIILLGGPEDTAQGNRIQDAVGERVYNACGKYNINGSASLVKQADKIVTNDTGLMHIAAAFRKEIISLWGNTLPEFGMSPYMPGEENKSHILEVKGLKCRPCSKLGYNRCPKGHFKCMQEIDALRIERILIDKI
jgi:ADP-heptose:LPS heptosyltransferase